MGAAIIASVWFLFAALCGSDRAWPLAIAFDQLGNAATGGDVDETISSRTWRCRAARPYCWLRPFIDFIMLHALGQADHCKRAYASEQAALARAWAAVK